MRAETVAVLWQSRTRRPVLHRLRASSILDSPTLAGTLCYVDVSISTSPFAGASRSTFGSKRVRQHENSLVSELGKTPDELEAR